MLVAVEGEGKPFRSRAKGFPSPSNSPISSQTRFIQEDGAARDRCRFPCADRPPKGARTGVVFQVPKKDFVLLGTEKPAGLAGFSVPYDQDLGESEEFVCAAGGRLPGNRRRHTRIAASSRKKRVGEGWGARGEGKPLRASQGVSFPRTSFYKPHSFTRRRQRSALLRV